ncbi:MAG: transglycosylase SLT domain-containing protein [bacterium]|nr:transglycosylase SLT domain-containing protein [bacterium]
MKFKFAIFFSAVSPLIVFAQGGLVPCGGQGQPSSTISCFYVLLDNIMNFLLYYISLPLAATAFMIAGIMLVLGGSEKAIARGKSILTFTVIGLLIAFGAWLIIDMILGNLLSPGYKPWNKFPSSQCAANPVSSSLNNQTTSNGLTVNNPNTSTAVFNIDEGSYEDGIDTNTPGFQSLENQPPEGTGLSPDTNPSSNCNANIPGYLVGANLNGVEPARVAAIIQAESSGISTASVIENDGGRSYGLMQVRPDTARLYDSSLAGLSDAQVGDKLINDPKYNINIGTKYYAALLQKYSNPTLASAAYNGGPIANRPSVNCANEPSSYGGTMRRWECPYDNNAHTIPNTGYAPTRKYTQNIDNFYQKNCSRNP